jgi:alpha-1,3-mannosyl-glycoprotein beta-1,2-N-acetylglucosaminyltransferase
MLLSLGAVLLLWLATAVLRGAVLPAVDLGDSGLPSGSRLSHLLGVHDNAQRGFRPPALLHDGPPSASSSHQRLRAEWVRQQLMQQQAHTSMTEKHPLYAPASGPDDTRPRPSQDPLAGVKAREAIEEAQRREQQQLQLQSQQQDAPIPVLLFTFNRADNLRSTLESVLANRPAGLEANHPIFISQDGADPATTAVAREFVDNAQGNPRRAHVHHLHFRWEDNAVPIEPAHMQWVTYYKIATHYKWALHQVFDRMAEGGVAGSAQPATSRFDHVILLEDDMHVSPDFFAYFRRTRHLLDADPTLLCVSAWNDNGRPPLSNDPHQLYRTDCFPGLGWLLSRRLWETELASKWPGGFWDDWLREPAQRQGRSCIYPSVNRVYTFGDKGSSAGQFFEQYLRAIRLNGENVEWDKEDLRYIETNENYRAFLKERISRAQRIQSTADLPPPRAPLPSALLGPADADHAASATAALSEHVWTYSSSSALDTFLVSHNMMTDHKAGVPRTAFAQVLTYTDLQRRRVWIVPEGSPFLEA